MSDGKTFALAMAWGGWPHMTEARKARLVKEIEFWFDCTAEEDWRHFLGWDHSENYPKDDSTFGKHRCFYSYLCDLFSEAFSETYFTSYHNGWSDDCQIYYDHSRFYDQLSCCLRAGIDTALCDGPGVVGFTLGDVKRMFDGQPPAWVFAGYDGIETAPDTAGIWL